jgi:hypothetical protein
MFVAALVIQTPTASPVVRAFEGICEHTVTVDAASERALAAGWTEISPSRETPMGEVVLMTRAAGAPAGDRVFIKTVDGHELHIWARETIPAPRGQFVECGVYDFAPAEANGTLDAIIASQGVTPTDNVSLADGTRQVGWHRLQGPSYYAGIDPACRVRPECRPRLVFYQSVPKAD